VNTSTTVIGAHINGWIFAEQTPTPAAPTVTVSVAPVRYFPIFSSITSAVVFGIGVALAVVGLVVMAAGLVIMRRLKKTVRRFARSAVHAPGNRLALEHEHRPAHPHPGSHGALGLTVPGLATGYIPRSYNKAAHELDGSCPDCWAVIDGASNGLVLFPNLVSNSYINLPFSMPSLTSATCSWMPIKLLDIWAEPYAGMPNLDRLYSPPCGRRLLDILFRLPILLPEGPGKL
jgi:hypothetical protein